MHTFLTASFKTVSDFAYWLIHKIVDKINSSPILKAMPKGAIIKVIGSIPTKLDHIAKLDFEKALADLSEREFDKFVLKFCLQLNLNRNASPQSFPPRDESTLTETDSPHDESTLSWIVQEVGVLAESIGHAVKQYQGIKLSAINFGLNFVVSKILDQLSISFVEPNIDEDQWRPLGIMLTTATIASIECSIASLINLLEKKCQAIYISREQGKASSSLGAAFQDAPLKEQQAIIVREVKTGQASASASETQTAELKKSIFAGLRTASMEIERHRFNKDFSEHGQKH